MYTEKKRCKYCEGKLGLLVAHHWGFRFCSRRHRDMYVDRFWQEVLRYKQFLEWLHNRPPSTP